MSWALEVGDTNLTGAALPRVRTSRGHDVGHALTPRAGSLSAVLEGEHDVLHAAVTLEDGSDAVWTGEVREQSRDYDARTRELRTQLRAAGPIAQIVAAGSGHGTNYYAGLTVDTAIGHLLDAIGFPAGRRDIGASPRVLDYWWLDHHTSAWQALLTLVRTAGPRARLSERADGTLVFRDEAAPAVPEAASVWRDVGSGDGPAISRLSRDEAGLERVVNDVAIEYRPVGSLGAEVVAALWGESERNTQAVHINNVLTNFIASAKSTVSASAITAAGAADGDLVLAIGVVQTSLPDAEIFRHGIQDSAWTELHDDPGVSFVFWRRWDASAPFGALGQHLTPSGITNLADRITGFEQAMLVLVLSGAADPRWMPTTADAAALAVAYTDHDVDETVLAPSGWTRIAGEITTSVPADVIITVGNQIYTTDYQETDLRLAVATAGGDTTVQSWTVAGASDSGWRLEVPPVRAVVYEHDATLVISGDETLDVEARSSSLFTAPLVPVEDTDYGVDAGSLDSVSLLPRNFGDRATIRLVASASGATVSDLQLRAIVVPDTTTEIASAEDAGSIAAYGAQQPRYQFWPYLAATEAQALADGSVAAGAQPRRSFTIGIDADRNTATREAALGAELGDHVQVLLDGSFREGGELAAIRHELGTGGTLRSELTIAGAGWVPFAPTGLAAATGDGAVTLSWTDPADDGVTGYQVRVSSDGGTTWSEWTDVDGSDATTTSHTVTELSNGTSYSLELRALGGGGADGATSVSATPPLKSAPSGLQASAGDGEVPLSWTDPSDTDLTGYQVRVSDDSGSTWSPDWTDITGSDATTVSHTVTGLTNGTSYSFELRALSAGGPGSAASISATPAAGP